MKRIIFASAAMLLTFISTQANTINTKSDNDKPSRAEKKEVREERKKERMSFRKSAVNNDVSYQSKQQFYRDFGDRPDVIWTRTKNFDEAAFSNNGTATTAFYDIDGNLVGTTSIKTFADLPEAGQNKILKEYKDYSVKNVVFFDDNENNDTDMVLYGNQFDDADNYFVELQKDNKTIIVQVTMDGLAGYFTTL